jgi:hypothetical protein
MDYLAKHLMEKTASGETSEDPFYRKARKKLHSMPYKKAVREGRDDEGNLYDIGDEGISKILTEHPDKMTKTASKTILNKQDILRKLAEDSAAGGGIDRNDIIAGAGMGLLSALAGFLFSGSWKGALGGGLLGMLLGVVGQRMGWDGGMTKQLDAKFSPIIDKAVIKTKSAFGFGEKTTNTTTDQADYDAILTQQQAEKKQQADKDAATSFRDDYDRIMKEHKTEADNKAMTDKAMPGAVQAGKDMVDSRVAGILPGGAMKSRLQKGIADRENEAQTIDQSIQGRDQSLNSVAKGEVADRGEEQIRPFGGPDIPDASMATVDKGEDLKVADSTPEEFGKFKMDSASNNKPYMAVGNLATDENPSFDPNYLNKSRPKTAESTFTPSTGT